jgi:3-oxoadipate CoA-transferase beta subunit
MSTASRYTREQMAARVAQDIPEGAYVNLGIGLPTKVANYLPAEREVCWAWARRPRPARRTKT